MWTKEGYVYSAVRYMEKKYGETFVDANMFNKDSVAMSLRKNRRIRVIAEYRDFNGNEKKEWGDNYLYYLHMDEIYNDAKEVADSVYENNKVYIKINKITNNFPVDVNILELYKRGTFTTYIYTDKDIEHKEEDAIKIKQGMYDKQMYGIVDINYLRKEDFEKMSEDKIDEVSMKGAYNVQTNLYMRDMEQDIEWRYGDFNEDLE
jgi:hypothetical protein